MKVACSGALSQCNSWRWVPSSGAQHQSRFVRKQWQPKDWNSVTRLRMRFIVKRSMDERCNRQTVHWHWSTSKQLKSVLVTCIYTYTCCIIPFRWTPRSTLVVAEVKRLEPPLTDYHQLHCSSATILKATSLANWKTGMLNLHEIYTSKLIIIKVFNK